MAGIEVSLLGRAFDGTLDCLGLVTIGAGTGQGSLASLTPGGCVVETQWDETALWQSYLLGPAEVGAMVGAQLFSTDVALLQHNSPPAVCTT